MKRFSIPVLLMGLALLSSPVKAENNVKIGKQNIKLSSNLMTPEALWAMGRIGAAEASADGKQIVYQIGYYSVKANKSQQKIAIINADGTGNTTLTTGSKSETDPTWYNGKIAFLTGGQLWTMNPDGSDRKQISKTSKDIEGFKFSPDGKKVILLHSLEFNEIIKKNPDDLPKATGRLVTDLMYRHWDHYVESIQHPFVADVTEDGIKDGIDILEGEPFECPMEPFGGIEQLDWAPDSKSIAYTCRKKTGLAYSISTDSDIYLYIIGTRETKNLCKPAGYVDPKVDPTKTLKYQSVNAKENLKNNVGYDQNPKFSPDGKYIAWTSMERDGYEADRLRLCVYNLATGEKKYVTESFDSGVDDFVWSDSKDVMIYFIGVWNATENLYAVNWKGELKQIFTPVLPQSGSEGQKDNSWADFGSIHLMNNGKQLLMERHSFTAPADLYIVTPNFKKPQNTAVQQLTFENKHITDQLAKPSVQQRWVKTSDGKQMLTWIILPPNFDETKKYPTLLFCEGGPQSPVSQFWSYRWNFMIMASQGYVVVAPNRRGLPGFGMEWLEEISGDYAGQCMKDYLAAIDDVKKEPFVDENRLGCVGASFGGYSVYWLAGNHDKRFKAFISHDGIFNVEQQYLETEELWFTQWDLGGPYWDKNPIAQKSVATSPHKYIEKWDTPILCIHGEKDYRILSSQGQSAFAAAILRGIPAELLLYPDENHWVLKPQNGILWQRTFFEWLDKWLKK